MKIHSFAAFAVFLLLIFSAFLISVSTNNANGTNLESPSSQDFVGTINITADSVIVYTGTGDLNIISTNGNTYTLNGKLYGSINIMRNNTVFNGQNNLITNNSKANYASLNITDANNVSLENIDINTSYQPGIYVNQSSFDSLSSLNVSSAIFALMLGANTSHISVTGSAFSLNTSIIANSFDTNTVAIGYRPSSNHPLITTGSKNIILANDTITNYAFSTQGGEALVNSANSVINNVSIKGVAAYGIELSGNNTTIKNSQFNGYLQYGILMGPAFLGYLSDINFTNNTFNLSSRYFSNGNPIEAIEVFSTNLTFNGNKLNIGNAPTGSYGTIYVGLSDINSNVKMYHNSFIMNNTGNSVAEGISASGSGTMKMIGNNFTMLNTELDTNYAIYGTGANITATNNSIFYQSNSQTSTGYGFNIAGGNFTATQNEIVSKGALITAFSASGTDHLAISANAMQLSGSSQMSGISLASISHLSETNVTGNSIIESASSGTSTGISLNNVINALVSNNAVAQAGENTAHYNGLDAQGVSYAAIFGNTLTGPGINAILGHGLYMKGVQNSTVANNTFESYNTTLYSLSSGNVTFDGNYFNGSYFAFNLTSTNYSVFYHNDFMNYRNDVFNISGSSHDSFSVALPFGGNYWQSYTGSDGNNDGIGDTPFTVNGTIVDQYPLMHPWKRPQAEFHAPSGINGTLWKVTFNGQTIESTGDLITFNILGGEYLNYSYQFYNSTLFYANDLSGSVAYNGSSLGIDVPYLHYSYITGQLNLSNFTVFINGKQINTTNGKFNFTVPAGNYTVVIKAAGYATFNHTYAVTPGETLYLNPSLIKASNSGSNPILEYAVAVVAVVAVLAGLIIYMRGRRKL